MKKSLFKKYFVGLLLFVLMVGMVQQPASAAATIDTSAEAAILVDAETGRILYEKNADKAMGIASMTKMMTEYLLLEAVAEGKVKWTDTYTVSPELSNMSHDGNLSNVYLRVGATYTVEELYSAMAIESANAATVAISEIVAGTEANFVKMMNAKAEELGLETYKFVNSSGLNNKDLARHLPIVGGPEEENVMSAKDVARLAFHLLKDYPEVLNTSSIPEKYFAKGTDDEFLMDNWNWMLEGYGDLPEDYPNFQQFVFEGMDGLKTGSTDYAGSCFTGTAERDGQRFISVVMNTDSNHQRFIETKKIMNYAFANYTEEEIVPKQSQVKGTKTLPVTKGKEDKVKITTKDAIVLPVQPGEIEEYKTVLKLDEKKLNEDGELTAPVKKGDKVGTLTIVPVDEKGADLEFLTKDGKKYVTVDVVAAEDVEKANWFILMMRGIGGFFSDLWGSITSTVSGWFD